jgi:hypothetical protein
MSEPKVGFNSVGIAIGLPLGRSMTSPLWGVALATQTYPLNTAVTHVVVQDEEVGEARNKIVDWAIEHKSTYVMFLDDDVILPPFGIQRLGYTLDTRGPSLYPDSKIAVCAGIYMSKEELTTPVVYKRNGHGGSWDWKVGEVFDVESVGTGCMLIHTEVFKHLEKPYFKTVEEYVEVNGQLGCNKITDDIYFCQKVKAAGFSILAHGGVLCGHYDTKTGKTYTIPEDSYPVIAAKEAEEKRRAEQLALETLDASV